MPFWPFRKEKPALSRAEALAAFPVRNPAAAWEEAANGEVAITVQRSESLKGRLFGLLFSVPKSRTISLDAVGSYVWELLDGSRDVAAVVAEFATEQKLNRREAEVSVTNFLRMLGERGLIVFALNQEDVNKIKTASAIQQPQEAPDSEGAQDKGPS